MSISENDSPVFDSHALRRDFDQNGFAVLPAFFSATTCDSILEEVDLYTSPEIPKVSRITVDVLHGSGRGRRVMLRDAPEDAFSNSFKINHLFTESAIVADSVFDARLRNALQLLLNDEPVVINSLNFKFGSQQPAHIDTWYMPPPIPGSLVVASVSLEDTRGDAGPLFYYPGSHRIPAYRFSHGGIHAVEAEMAECRRYLEHEIAARNLKAATFMGKKGDVFLWHCQLLHGGTPITNPRSTRSSLVIHYWGSKAVGSAPVAKIGGGKYLDRDYWETDGKALDWTPRIRRQTTVIPPNVKAVDVVQSGDASSPHDENSRLHVAFETWNALGESLESVENRIHDGAPRHLLHDRANGYLDTFEKLFPNTAPQPGARLMEIGSGVGYIMEAALQRYRPSKITGLDVAAGMIEMAQRRLARDGVNTNGLNFIHYDGESVPLASDSLDFIYSVASLQHAPRAYCYQALTEAYRLVRVGGTVWIHLLDFKHFRNHTSPASFRAEINQQIHEHKGHWHHYYSKEELDSVLEYGIGVKPEDFRVQSVAGSLYVCFGKRK